MSQDSLSEISTLDLLDGRIGFKTVPQTTRKKYYYSLIIIV